MSEPTIDEMLELLDAAFLHLAGSDLYVNEHYDGTLDRTSKAIRAILEQHRESEVNRFKAIIRLEEDAIIRAFVERVNERYLAWGEVGAYGDCVRDELAAMEKENESSA